MDRKGSTNVQQQPWAATKYQLLQLSLLQLAHQRSLRLRRKVKIDISYSTIFYIFAKYIYIFASLAWFTKRSHHNVSPDMVHVLYKVQFHSVVSLVVTQFSVRQRRASISEENSTFIFGAIYHAKVY